MPAADWQQVKTLFHGALARAPSERPTFLDESCGDDLALRSELDSLLALASRAETFLDEPASPAALLTLKADEDPPERLGHYRIRRCVGRGGAGAVYFADDQKLKRSVALKILNRPISNDEADLSELLREARLLAAMNHPNIATIHSLDTQLGYRFMTMEWVEGGTLGRWLEEDRTLDERLDCCRQVAQALEAAHANDIAHLDLKPQNIMITEDRHAKVLDFGVARALGSAEEASSGIRGTPGYVSPEQLRGAQGDERSDIWAFGCVLYEALSGRPVFRASTTLGILEATCNAPICLDYPEEAPGPVRELVDRCLRREPDGRPGSMTEVRRVLAEALQTRRISVGEPDTLAHLPAQPTAFLGRTAEKRELANELRDVPLMTLTGIGGCGKTRLALELARSGAAHHRDGARWIDLAAVSDPSLVAGAAARALGVSSQPGATVEASLLSWLQPREVLLVLDNCEHLRGACSSLVSTLLSECPGVRILATSRERFDVPGETVRPIAALAVPAKGETAADLAESDAVLLLVDRLLDARPDFRLTDDAAPAVARICRELDGIPLALELAAAQATTMSVPEIADRLHDRSRLLDLGRVPTTPQQRTLRAAFDWSHSLLTEAEKILFRRLSVFALSWDLAAAEEVCASDDDLPTWEILDLLSQLIDKSLVQIDTVAEDPTGHTRYRFLETVRQYAHLQCEEAGEVAPIRDQHGAYYLDLAKRADASFETPDSIRWLGLLDTERRNCEAALDIAFRSVNCDRALRLAATLGRYYLLRGDWNDGRKFLERALEMRRADDDGDPSIVATVLQRSGLLAMVQGDYEEAQSRFEKSLALWEEQGDGKGRAGCLSGLGHVARRRLQYDESADLYARALQLWGELDAERAMAGEYNNLGLVAQETGDYDTSDRYFEKALEINRRLDNENWAVRNLYNLGLNAGSRGSWSRARQLFEQCSPIYESFGDKQGLAGTHQSIGEAFHKDGELAAAREHMERALDLLREIGDRPMLPTCLVDLASIARSEGRTKEERLLLEEAGDHREYLRPEQWVTIAERLATLQSATKDGEG